MRSATRRATVAATAASAVLLLGACTSTTGTAASAPSVGSPVASAPTPSGANQGTGATDSATPSPVSAPTQASPATPTAVPVLGTAWATGVHGYGIARPAGLDNGGDPTGIVTNLTWSSWGSAQAKGTGTAEYVAPGQSVAQGSAAKATIVAFNPGMCHGKPAYRDLEWYFPAHGQHFDPNHYFDACTGQDHGM